jgi:phosphotransferase system HPr (HPr) family protein
MTVFHPDGVHIRPATELVALTRLFHSTIHLEVDRQAYRADALIDLLSAHLHFGKKLTVIAEGADAETAVATLERFFARHAGDSSREARQIAPTELREPLRRAA